MTDDDLEGKLRRARKAFDSAPNQRALGEKLRDLLYEFRDAYEADNEPLLDARSYSTAVGELYKQAESDHKATVERLVSINGEIERVETALKNLSN